MTFATGAVRNYGTPEAQALVAAAAAMAPDLQKRSSEIEAGRRLPEDIVAALRDAGFMHALLPGDLGGREVDPVNAARIAEEIAVGDASAGWCVMLAAQSCAFAGFLPTDEARTIWGDGGIVAGTARPIGRAVVEGDSFRVSGRWPFASGSTHATWFAAECVVYDGDEKRTDENGNDVTRMVFAPAAEVTIIDTWDTLGLRGTASNDFTIAGALVPQTRAFQVLVSKPIHDWPLYRNEPLVFINHGAQALGVARAAVQCAVETAAVKVGWGGVMLKDTPRLQGAIAEATALVGSAACYLYDSAWSLWEQALAGDTDAGSRARVRLANSHAARSAVQAVDLLHAALGTTSVMSSSPLSRHLRDIHTAAAHVMIGSMTFEASGRALMGMDPQFPFF